MNSDFFKFEETDLDFPFYNDKPQMSVAGWLLLTIGLILNAGLALGLWNYIPGAERLGIGILIVNVLVVFIPVAYCCRGKLGLVVRMPKLKDMKVVVICVVAYFAYTIAINMILNIFGVVGTSNPLGQVAVRYPIGTIIILAVSLIGEEFFKLIALVLGMGAAYGITKDRKKSIIMGTVFCCIIFGLIHMSTYDYNIPQCLLLIGIGCAIHLYPYLKTKNLTNSYLTHILIDLMVFVPIMIMGSI